MVAYRNFEGKGGLGPDYVRMCWRFEVANSIHEAEDFNMLMRTMSYCMQLGDIAEVRKVI